MSYYRQGAWRGDLPNRKTPAQSALAGDSARSSQSAHAEPADAAPVLRGFEAGLYCHKRGDTSECLDTRQVSP